MTETFTHKGREFTFDCERDDCMSAPWKEHDGHGIVSDWTTRDKLPGERVLASDRNSKRFYDIAATTKIAKRDGWGLGDDAKAAIAAKLGRAPTRKEIIAAAVEHDFGYLRAWCNDEWQFVVLCVNHPESGATEYLGGAEDSDPAYIMESARELADEICDRLDAETAQLRTLADAYGCEV